ncbi:MAG: prolyl oligopeptidase family serine peptidase, partial [Terriglobales bacterium]
MNLRCLAALPLLATLALAQQHAPSFNESLEMQAPSAPALSPDGRWVAYGVRAADWEQNAYVTQLWLASSDGSRRFQLTRGRKSAGMARWSPDGRWIAFVAERPADADRAPAAPPAAPAAEAEDRKPAPRQIWLISPSGGEAWAISRHPTDVNDFRWSPDGRRIAFTAAAHESPESKRRGNLYSDFTVFEHDYTQTQLFSLDAAAAEPAQMPAGDVALVSDRKLNVAGFDWSPDGAQIAFAATPDPLLADGSESDIYLVRAEPGAQPRKIVALPGPETNPKFSPDGTQLVFQTALAQPENFYANQHLATVSLAAVVAQPATSAAAVRDLTGGFDEDPSLIGWGPGGIYFSASQKTEAAVFRLAPGGTPQRLNRAPSYRVTGASFSRDDGAWAFLSSDPTHMAEVEVSPAAGFAPQRVTDFSRKLAAYTLGTAEVISWKSSDGTTIEGVLHKPADFVAGRKYPLLVVIHGGPTGVSNAALNPVDSYYPIQRFLARGALVLEPNYRGSAGYGASFRALNVRNLGVGDMWDVMSGVDALIARGLADPAHLGAMGWSEGGYISAFLTTHTDRFQAISVGAGISDWTTYY